MKNGKTFFSVLLLLAAAALQAALPADALRIEAESFRIVDRNSWQVKPHFPHWYGSYPLGGKFLAAPLAKKGIAVKEIAVATPGSYRLFVRYLDILTAPASFVLTVSQNGKVLASREFNKKSLRLTAAGKKKFGKAVVTFVWQSVDFTAAAGKVLLELKVGSVHKGVEHGSRHIDALLLTGDMSYQPEVRDFLPLYIKVRMLPENGKPAVAHMFIRRGAAPYFLHCSLGRKGLVKGVETGGRDNFIAPGGESVWFKLDELLHFGRANRIHIYPMTAYRGNQIKNGAFELLFSRTPNDRGIFRRILRKGLGTGMLVGINVATEEIIDGTVESRKLLEYAENARQESDYPDSNVSLDYPFFTSGYFVNYSYGAETQENLQKTLKLLGLNGSYMPLKPALDYVPFGMVHGSIMGLTRNKCLRCPDHKKIDRYMKEVAAKVKHYKMPLVNLADEPNMRVERMLKCKQCQAGFADYLKRNNAGVSGKMTIDNRQGLLYYWTIRYRNELFTTMMKAGTEALKKYHPGAVTTVNFGIEGVTTGAIALKGLDWFSIFGTGALTFGWHEDWANLTGSYQINGFLNDVMRAACRKRGTPYGMFNILSGRSQWDIQAKGFNIIGHGNKAMGFFNFGPHFSTNSDTNSQRKEIYLAIRNVTHATGPVAKDLMAGKVARGEIAMLQSYTHDIWHSPGTNKTPWQNDNLIGKERVFLHLLLRHCGYRMDILSEDDLDTELRHYKVLAAVDSHIRKDRVAPLLRWVENGGTLFMTANALMYDEANRPLNFPVKREKFTFVKASGRGEFNMPNLATIAKIGTLDLKSAYQKPFNRDIRYGKGRIIACGFLPGISYHSTSKAVYSTDVPGGVKNKVREYRADFRNYIKKLNFPVKPRLTSSVYNVEANLIEAPEADIIVLANFSGKPKKVTVTLDGKKFVKNIKAGAYIKVAKTKP